MMSELQRITTDLSTAGYAATTYEGIGLSFDTHLAGQLASVAMGGTFSDSAAELTKRIEKKEMRMVQDEQSLELGRQLVKPAVEVLFAHNPSAIESWELYAMNCYETGGELGVHQDSVEKTVLVITASGVRQFDVFGKEETEESGFGKPEQTFMLSEGSIMILDAEADPGHAIKCIEGPSVSAVLDVPGLLRPQP